MRIIRSRIYPYVIIWVILVSLLYSLVGDYRGAITFWLAAGITILFGLLLVVGSMNKIILSENGIIHQMAFVRQEILWRDVYKSNFSLKPSAATLVFTLFIESYNGQKIDIPLGHFARRDMGVIAKTVVSNCPTALIGDKVKNMAAGKFPWYVF